MDFYSLEAQDGIRFSWNNFPSSKIASTKAVIPISLIYSPMKDIENLALVEYDPIRCRCTAVLNPYCQVDFKFKCWFCPFCGTRNNFPPHYAEHITESTLPAELMQEYTTIEYISSKPETLPNAFLFIIDTCLPEEELFSLRDSIQQILNFIPPDALVGLITFNRYVYVHELGHSECPKSYAFKGNKEYTSLQIQEQLGISVKNDPRGAVHKGELCKRFLLPLSSCEFTLNSILDDLQCDSWTIPQGERQLRSTGSAFNIALSMMESSPIMGGRIISFLGGPCTHGPGKVVGLKLEETIRGWIEIEKNENVTFLKDASKFYSSLATRAVTANLVFDIFEFSLDQFGLLEMKSLGESTGGYIIMNEQFDSQVFKMTLNKFFEKDANGDLKMGFAGKLDLFMSKELKVNGAIGPCTSLKKAGPLVAEQEIGQGKTTSWYVGGLDRVKSLAFYFEVNPPQNDGNVPQGKLAYFQFSTCYKHSSGQIRMRVTTTARNFAEKDSVASLAEGFDQEAACAIMARLAINKVEKEDNLEVLKWIDRSLIRLICRFANYKPERPETFELNPAFSLYPQFMYHLRRGNFIKTYGASPDESTYFRQTLFRENTTNTLVMIQPALLEYTLENPLATPVAFEVDSMKPDVILLLDTYFHVVVWHGENIHQWELEGYHEQEEYQNLKEALLAPNEDVKLIMEDRFPVPRHIVTHHGHGNTRYLKSRLIPTVDKSNLNVQSGEYLSDDASLKCFLDHLVNLVVQFGGNK